MSSLTSTAIKVDEFERLSALIPPDLQPRVSVVRSSHPQDALITTSRVGNRRFSIQLDLIRWSQLPENQRDLLFWHEIGRIQTRAVNLFPWEAIALVMGLGVASLEVLTQNILVLSAALLVTGLASNQLYQQNRGERSLRRATRADQAAIHLAVQHGYSLSQAYQSLRGTLMALSRSTSKKALWKKYQVRLNVLDMLIAEHQKSLQPLEIDVNQDFKDLRQPLPVESFAYRPDAC